MAAEKIGSIYWDLDLDDKKFKKGVSSASSSIDGLTSKFKQAETGSFALLGVIGTLGAGLVSFGLQGIRTAGELESMEAALTTVTGSSEQAAEAMKTIKQVAKDSPFFETATLAQFVQLMAASGQQIDEAVDSALRFGDVAAAFGKGNAEMTRMGNTLSQVMGKGKADAVDFKELVNAGWVSVRKDTAEAMGVTMEQFEEMVSAGLVGYGEISKAAEKFSGAAEKQSTTLNAIWNRLKESVSTAFADFVIDTGIFNAVKEGIDGLIGRIDDMMAKFEEAGGALNYFRELIRDNQSKVMMVAGALLGALLPALIAITAAIWGALAPLLPFIAAGALLGLGIQEIVEHFGGWRAVMEKMRPIFDKVMDKIMAFKEIIEGIVFAIQTLDTHNDILFNGLQNLGLSADQARVMLDKIHIVLTFLRESFEKIKTAVLDFKTALQEFVQSPQFQMFMGMVRNLAENIINNLKNAFITLVVVFREQILPSVSKLIEALKPLVEAILPILAVIVGGLILLFMKLVEIWTSVLAKEIQIIGDIFQWLVDRLVVLIGIITDVINFFVWLATTIYNFGVDAYNALQSFYNQAKSVFEEVKGFIDSAIQKFNTIKGAIDEALKDVAEAIKQPFREAFNWLGDKVNWAKDQLSKLDPTKRFSPSLVDKITMGTSQIKKLYGDMFSDLNTMALQNRSSMTGAVDTLSGATGSGDGNTPLAQGATQVVIAPQGIIARSKGELRDITLQMLDTANEALRAKGKPQIAT